MGAGKPLQTANAEPGLAGRGGGDGIIVAGKKCDTSFGVGVREAVRQSGLTARL